MRVTPKRIIPAGRLRRFKRLRQAKRLGTLKAQRLRYANAIDKSLVTAKQHRTQAVLITFVFTNDCGV